MLAGYSKGFKKVLAFLLAVLIVLTSCFIPAITPRVQAAEQISYYVSTAGDDSNPGTEALPFATIEKARDTIRTINSDMTGDIYVYIRGGQYYLNSTVNFDENDSGTNGFKIVYTNYPGETPEIYGGQKITGWEAVAGTGYYRAKIDAGWSFGTMFVNDQMATVARYPNQGYITFESASGNTFTYRESDNVLDFNPTNDKVSIYCWPGPASWNYYSCLVPVTAVDNNTRTITLEDGLVVGAYQYSVNDRYFLQGAKEFLDAPGEYYVDSQNGYVYYYPKNDSGDIAAQTIIAPKMRDIFSFKGSSSEARVKNITLDGLVLSCSDYSNKFYLPVAMEKYTNGSTVEMGGQDHENNKHGTVYFENAQNNEVKNCKIINNGTNGVVMNYYSQYNTLYGNYINNTGNNAVLMTGKPVGKGDVTNHNNVVNCMITSFGKTVGSGCGVTMYNAGYSNISYNVVKDGPRMGIYQQGYPGPCTFMDQYTDPGSEYDYKYCQYNTVSYNEVADVMKDSQDGGAIYTQGSGKGNVYDNNYIHDIVSGMGSEHLAMGIYMDDDSSYYTIKNNLITGQNGDPYFLKGIYGVIDNNIGSNHVNSRANASFQKMRLRNDNLTFMRNIFYDNSDTTKVFNFIDWTDGIMTKCDFNMYYNANGIYGISGAPGVQNFSQWQLAGYDASSLTGDPNFVDPNNGDYRLKYNSQAYGLKIKDINYKDIGVKEDFRYTDPTDTLDRIFVVTADNSASVDIQSGNTYQINLMGRTSKGYIADLSGASITYTSDNTSAATVDSNGLVTAKSKGVAKITIEATKGGVTKTTSLFVLVDDNIKDISVFASKTQLPLNGTSEITVSAQTDLGRVLSADSVSFTSSDDTIATVDENGIVTALKSGNAIITVSYANNGNEILKTLGIQVFDNILASAKIIPSRNFVYAGDTISLTSSGTMSNGQPVDMTGATVEYSSDNESILTVDNTGTVHGISEGFANVAAVVTLANGLKASTNMDIIVYPYTASKIPSEWNVTYWGGAKGVVTFNNTNGAWNVESNGWDIWGGADNATYVYQKVTPELGNIVTMYATIGDFPDGARGAHGIMIRSSEDSNASHFQVRAVKTGDNKGDIYIVYRAATGGSSWYGVAENIAFPMNVKIEKQGSLFKGYYKDTQGQWQLIGTPQTIGNFGDTFLVGMATYSQTNPAVMAHTNIYDVNLEETPVEFDNIKLVGGSYIGIIGGTAQLNVKGYYGDNLECSLSGATVTYQSLNSDVATVDQNGLVTGISKGKATISVTVVKGDLTLTKTKVISIVEGNYLAGDQFLAYQPDETQGCKIYLDRGGAAYDQYIVSGGESIGGYLMWSNVDFGEPGSIKVFEAIAAVEATYAGLSVQLRIDSRYGDIIGKLPIKDMGNGWADLKEQRVSLSADVSGVHDLYLEFVGTGHCNLRSFKFLKEIVNVTGISLNKSETQLNVYTAEQLVATVVPQNATNPAVKWSSSNPNIASVNNGRVTGWNAGTAKITATTEDGNLTADCMYTIIRPEKAPLKAGDLFLAYTPDAMSGCKIYLDDPGRGPADQYIVDGGSSKGGYLMWSQVDFEALGTYDRFEAVAAVGIPYEGLSIQISIDNPDTGTVIGTLPIKDMSNGGDGWATLKEQVCSISQVSGKHDLYLKFVGTNHGNVRSFRFLKAQGTGVKLDSTSWTATGNDNPYASQFPPSNGIDGTLSTQWYSGNDYATSWYCVDMKSVQTFDVVKMYSAAGDYPRGFSMYVSNDGVNFGNAVYTGVGASGENIIKLETQNAQYIKIALTTWNQGAWWSIQELEAWKTIPDTIPVESITVSAAGGITSVTAGGTLQMSAAVLPANATDASVTWSIATGSAIATISETGLLTANAAGTVTVKATAKDGSNVYGTYEITVLPIVPELIPVESITVSAAGGATTVTAGGTLQMSAAVLPANATDTSVTWSIVMGSAIATISETGLLTANAAGTVTVKATAKDGSNVYGTYEITVLPIVPETIPVESITVSAAGGATTVTAGGTLQMSATVLPANATDISVTWSIATGSAIATISETGLLTANAAGTVTVKATAKDGSNVYGTYEITVLAAASSGQNPVTETKPESNIPGTVKVAPTMIDGVATVSIPDSTLGKALTESEKVVIEVPKTAGSLSYVISLPVETLKSAKAEQKIEFATEYGTITASANMLSSKAGNGASKVGIEISTVDTSKLPSKIINEIGNRPVIELNLKVDGETKFWNNPKEPVTVSIPYSPSAEELLNPEHIVVRYLDGKGKIVAVPTGRYDAKTGMVTFTTTHFSQYAVAFVDKTFKDLQSYTWAKNSIEVLASKGIISGTSTDKYAPSAEIKRADFIVLLVKALGLSAETEDNFIDVAPDAYYAEALAIAKKLGITSGVGNNRFNPETKITRQDMMVLINKAMSVAGKSLVAGTTNDLNQFFDESDVSSYAKKSAATLVKNGIVSGDGINLNPLGNATRAETAVMIYKIYNK